MKLKSLKTDGIIMKKMIISSLVALSFNATAAITIHEAVSFSGKDTQEIVKSSAEIVNARGRQMSLELALDQIVPLMDVRFTEPNLKNLAVNWRANNEHFGKVLTRLARQYPIDFVINESADILYVDVDQGRCVAHRELKLDEMARAWEKLNINDQPVLPTLLPVQADLAGYLIRYC